MRRLHFLGAAPRVGAAARPPARRRGPGHRPHGTGAGPVRTLHRHAQPRRRGRAAGARGRRRPLRRGPRVPTTCPVPRDRGPAAGVPELHPGPGPGHRRGPPAGVRDDAAGAGRGEPCRAPCGGGGPRHQRRDGGGARRQGRQLHRDLGHAGPADGEVASRPGRPTRAGRPPAPIAEHRRGRRGRARPPWTVGGLAGSGVLLCGLLLLRSAPRPRTRPRAGPAGERQAQVRRHHGRPSGHPARGARCVSGATAGAATLHRPHQTLVHQRGKPVQHVGGGQARRVAHGPAAAQALREAALGAYLAGLEAAGWRGDPRRVRVRRPALRRPAANLPGRAVGAGVRPRRPAGPGRGGTAPDSQPCHHPQSRGWPPARQAGRTGRRWR